MGRITRTLVTLVLVLGLAACGGDTTDTEAPADTEAPSTVTPTEAPDTTTASATEAPGTTSAPDTETPATTLATGGVFELLIGAVDSEGFSTTTLEAPAGEISVTFDNEDEGGEPHNWHVKISDGEEYATTIKQGPDTQTVTFSVGTPGEYDYWCDTHPTAMTGTLVVTP